MPHKTLLDCINEIFKRTNVISGDAQALTSLIDAARQNPIDVSIQVVNEGIDELYSYANVGKPGEQKEATVILVNGVQEYTLADDLVLLHFPLIDKTNTQFISQFPGGYDKMLLYDPEQDDTGLPVSAAINPVNDKLHMDRIPTSVEAGKVYTYQYDRDLVLTLATDEVPFGNAVFRAMVSAWVRLYQRDMNHDFDAALYRASLGRAARFLSQVEPVDNWSPRG